MKAAFGAQRVVRWLEWAIKPWHGRNTAADRFETADSLLVIINDEGFDLVQRQQFDRNRGLFLMPVSSSHNRRTTIWSKPLILLQRIDEVETRRVSPLFRRIPASCGGVRDIGETVQIAMVELSGKVKVALDETRTLILGSQILIGFQFRAAFEDGFFDLPAHARCLDGVALILMLSAGALLIAPGTYHRIVEQGRDSQRFHRLISVTTGIALMPFAISLGVDLFITAERMASRDLATLAGVSFFALALSAWYGVELLRLRSVGSKERAMAEQRATGSEPTPLHNRIEQMLTEARVILPGAQALLGFQLAITITRSFSSLDAISKLLHAISLALIALTVVLLMAPAAYHRIIYAGEDNEEFHRTGSILVTAATIPLALGLGCEVYVVISRIFSPFVGGAAALTATTGFIGLWHLYPLAVRRRVALRAGGR